MDDTGDVQPYVALGKLLVRDGHRVRIATHEIFHSFVQDEGLEFFNIGGNPQDLMSYMVKSECIEFLRIPLFHSREIDPGLIPGRESLTNGDICRKRNMLTEVYFPHVSERSLTERHKMIDGCWLACSSPDRETGRTFAADAIISNPPAFAHIHCAEALGIPCLLSFSLCFFCFVSSNLLN
jgi:sterol 3beta-glucosyltransferase